MKFDVDDADADDAEAVAETNTATAVVLAFWSILVFCLLLVGDSDEEEEKKEEIPMSFYDCLEMPSVPILLRSLFWNNHACMFLLYIIHD